MDEQHDELTDTGILRIQRAAEQANDGLVAHFTSLLKPIDLPHAEKMKRAAALTATVMAVVLSGCATLERHPIATAVIVGIAAGSIAASTNHREPARTGDMPAMCRTQPEACR